MNEIDMKINKFRWKIVASKNVTIFENIVKYKNKSIAKKNTI